MATNYELSKRNDSNIKRFQNLGYESSTANKTSHSKRNSTHLRVFDAAKQILASVTETRWTKKGLLIIIYQQPRHK